MMKRRVKIERGRVRVTAADPKYKYKIVPTIKHKDVVLYQIDLLTKYADIGGIAFDWEHKKIGVVLVVNEYTLRPDDETEKNTIVWFKGFGDGWMAVTEINRYTLYVTMWKVK